MKNKALYMYCRVRVQFNKKQKIIKILRFHKIKKTVEFRVPQTRYTRVKGNRAFLKISFKYATCAKDMYQTGRITDFTLHVRTYF